MYPAVLHGCRAGLHQEAFDQVFVKRIRRFNEHYSVKKLGTFGADLSALWGFFTEPWARPVPMLRESTRTYVLGDVSFALRALGRLEEAVGPLRTNLALRLAQKKWKNAAGAAANLSALQLALGQLKEATASARQAVELADKSGDLFLRSFRSRLADALHQGGQTAEAEHLFVEAEAIQRNWQPEFPLLYGVQGYLYSDLLLMRGKTDEVLRRAEQALKLAIRNFSLLEIGLDNTALGCAHLARLTAGRSDAVDPARHHFNQAVSRLREAGQQDYLALGLIHRAAFFRNTRDFPSATLDLDEALRLATRGHMRLREADAHLEHARLLLAQGLTKDARSALARAQTIITQTGYHRRDPEVAALAKELDG